MALLDRNRIANLIEQIEDVIQLDDHRLLESQLNRMRSLLLAIRTQLSYGQTAPIETLIHGFERMEKEFRSARLLIGETLDRRDSQWPQRRFDCLLRNRNPKANLSEQIIKWKRNVDELYKELKKLSEHTELTDLVKTGPKNGEVVVESWLREAPHLRIIGVCGGAGVGKTRLLQNVYESYKVSDFFDVVIWVTVGQLDIPELQDCIARTVNLDLAAHHSIDLDMRKIKLFEYFRVKKFLLIFDDISVPLNLKKLGVGFGDDKGSKIICSSRTKDVIEKTWAKCGIYIEPLTRGEAWELFCNVAFKDGHLPQDSQHDSQHIARKVANECRGLPLAIHVVAATMRGNTSLNDWNLALRQMQTTVFDHKFPTSYRSIDDHLYQLLRWSYERLPDANFKSCFLYCAMFPRDEEIEVEKLVGMWIAEGIVKSMDTVHSYIKLLEDRCLFQVTRIPHGKVFIKTCNPLRDLAMYIGNKEEHCLFMAGGQVQADKFIVYCFLYCAMFPRDHEIEVDKMVGMWIAESLVDSMDTAHSYLKLLVDRCFFQVTRIPHGKVFIKTCNPLRDVAIYIGNREEHCLFMAGGQVQNFLFIADRQVENFPGEIERNDWKRITFYGNNIKCIPPQRLNCRNLVSLILGANKELEEVSMSFLEQLPSIRVLDLSRTNINILPITLWSRKHLQYLDLSYTQIEYLSEYIANLCELQFLNLSGCSKLESLPEAIGHLSQLQFLNLSGCSRLTSIPSVIYELKSLKHLYISQYKVLL